MIHCKVVKKAGMDESELNIFMINTTSSVGMQILTKKIGSDGSFVIKFVPML